MNTVFRTETTTTNKDGIQRQASKAVHNKQEQPSKRQRTKEHQTAVQKPTSSLDKNYRNNQTPTPSARIPSSPNCETTWKIKHGHEGVAHVPKLQKDHPHKQAKERKQNGLEIAGRECQNEAPGGKSSN